MAGFVLVHHQKHGSVRQSRYWGSPQRRVLSPFREINYQGKETPGKTPDYCGLVLIDECVLGHGPIAQPDVHYVQA